MKDKEFNLQERKLFFPGETHVANASAAVVSVTDKDASLR